MDTVHVKKKDEFAPSRGAYIAGSLFNYFIALLTSGTFFAKLATTVGLSDSMTAILGSFATFAGMFQLISIFLAHKTPVKRWVVPVQFLSNLLLAFLYLIPLMNMSGYLSVLFFLILILTKAGVSIITPSRVNWFFALCDDNKRGAFQAKNNIISFAGGIVFTYVIGIIIDSFEARGDVSGSFTVLVIIIFVLSLLELGVMLSAKEKPENKERAQSPFGDIKSLFSSKKYRRMLLLYISWNCALNVTIPFLGTYQISELGFSMTIVATISAATSALNMLTLYLFGRYSTKHSYASMLRISYPVAIAAFLALALSGSGTFVLFYLVFVLLRVIYGELHTVADLNLIYGAVPTGQRTAAMAVNTMVVGLSSFLTTLAASPLVDYVQSVTLELFGRPIYAQQILAAISALIITGVALFYHFGCKPMLEKNTDNAN